MGSVFIGSDEYPIIGTEADADAYLAGSPWAVAWESADEDPDDPFRQARALITASRQITELSWKGTTLLPYDPRPSAYNADPLVTQPYAWPRTGVTDCEGLILADGTPAGIEIAVYVLAALAIDDPELFAETEAADGGIKSIQAGSAKIEYFGPGASTLAGLPDAIRNGIQCYLIGAGTTVASGVGTAYGTCGEFEFDDCDEFGLTGPL